MDDQYGPYFDTDLIQNGRLKRLHKGGGSKPPKTPQQPARKGEPAKTVEMVKEQDPTRRRNRGYGSTILSTGLASSNENGTSILGG